jgi:hypothetical protein
MFVVAMVWGDSSKWDWEKFSSPAVSSCACRVRLQMDAGEGRRFDAEVNHEVPVLAALS